MSLLLNRTQGRRLATGVFKGTLVGLAAGSLVLQPVLAAPHGAEISHGTADIQSVGTTTTITNSPGTVINWQQFDLAADELARFVQQGTDSAVLNRVVGQALSDIQGTLSSNGRVFLINPNGLVVGEGAVIDTAGFVGSTLNITDADFLAGNLRFAGNGGTLVNEGLIVARQGDVLLVAPLIDNAGIIRADNGDILLAAGQGVTVSDLANPQITFDVQAPGDAVVNLGELIAAGAVRAFAGSLTSSGHIEATGVTLGANGEIVLSAAGDLTLAADSTTRAAGGTVLLQAGSNLNNTLWLAGAVNASGPDAGGLVTALGDRVGLQGSILADGATGGGAVFLGGSQEGAGPLPNSSALWLGPDSVASANATGNGDGGTIIAFSDGNGSFHGRLSARGGAAGGNGGFIETSARGGFDNTAIPDVGALLGNPGTWLIDPVVIDIREAADTSGNLGQENPEPDTTFLLQDRNNATPAILRPSQIVGALEFGNVLVQADNDLGASVLAPESHIQVSDPIVYSGANARTLEFRAQTSGGQIFVNAPISSTGTGLFDLVFRTPGNPGPTTHLNANINILNGRINSPGERFEFTNNDGVSSDNVSINTPQFIAGDIVSGAALVVINSDITADNLSVEAGHLTLNGSNTFTNLTLDPFDTGLPVLVLNSGNTVANLLTLRGGTLDGIGNVTTQSAASIGEGPGPLTLRDQVAVNLNLPGVGIFNPSTLNLLDSSSINLVSGLLIQDSFATSLVQGSGFFTQAAGSQFQLTGSTTFDAPAVFAGDIILNGDLTITGASNYSGTMDLNGAGSAFAINNGANTFTLLPGADFSVSTGNAPQLLGGQVFVTAGSTPTATDFIAAGGQLTTGAGARFNVNNLAIQGATLDGDGTVVALSTFAFDSGTLTGNAVTEIVTNGAINTTTTKFISGNHILFTNSGANPVDWFDGNIVMSDTALIQLQTPLNINAEAGVVASTLQIDFSAGNPQVLIAPTGSLNLAGASNLIIDVNLRNDGTLTNQGTAELRLTRGGSSPFGATYFADTGDINFQTGTFNLDAGTTFTGSAFNTLNGATVALNNGGFTATNLRLTAGSLLVNNANLSISNSLDWTGGSMVGSSGGVGAGSNNTFSGGTKTITDLQLTLPVSSSTSWTAGTIVANESGSLSVNGTLNLDGNLLLDTGSTAVFAPSVTVNGDGRINHNGTGTSTIDLNSAILGAVNVTNPTGTLRFTRQNSQFGLLSPGTGTIDFSSGLSFLNAGTTFAPDSGLILFSGAQVQVASGVTVSPNNLNLSAGSLDLQDGTLDAIGQFTWQGGQILGTGTFDAAIINNFLSGTKVLTQATLLLPTASTTTWSTGTIQLNDLAVLDLAGDLSTGNVTLDTGAGEAPVFVVEPGATLTHNGTGNLILDVSTDHNGTITAGSVGDILLTRGGTSTGNFAPTVGDIRFSSNTYTWDTGTSFGVGLGAIEINGATVAQTAATTTLDTLQLGNGTLDLMGNTTDVQTQFEWTGGTLIDSTNTGGTLLGAPTSLLAGGTKILTDAVLKFDCCADVNWSSGTIVMNNNAVLDTRAGNDGGGFDITGNVVLDTGATATGTPLFINRDFAVVSVSGGGTSTIDVQIANAGDLRVIDGTLNLSRGSDHTGFAFLSAGNGNIALTSGTHTLFDNTTVGATAPFFLRVTGGTLVADPSSAAVIDRLDLNNGTLVNNTTTTVTDFRWGGGTLTDTGLGNGPRLLDAFTAIFEGGTKTIDSTQLSITGTGGTWSSGTINMNNDALLLLDGGSLDITGNVTLNQGSIATGTPLARVQDFANFDGILSTSNTGVATIDVLLELVPGSNLLVNTGETRLTRSSLLSARSTVAPGALLRFTQGGGHTTLGDHNFVGTTEVAGGTLTVDGLATFDDLQVSSGVLAVGAASNVNINGNLLWTGGVLQPHLDGPITVLAGAAISIETASLKTLRSGVLDIQSITGSQWLDGGINFDDNAILHLSGALAISGNNRTMDSTNGIGSLVVFSPGTITHTGAATTNFDVLVTNNGTITVLDGTFEMQRGGVSSGQFVANAPGIVRFDNGGAFQLLDGASTTGSGFVELNGTGTTLDLAASGAINMDQLRLINGSITGTPLQILGSLEFQGGSLANQATTIAAGSNLVISGNGLRFLDGGTFTNNSTQPGNVFQDTGNLQLRNGAQFINAGQLSLAGDGRFDCNGVCTTELFSNLISATLTRDLSTGTFLIDVPTTFAPGTSISVNTGTLSLSETSQFQSDASVASGALLQFANGDFAVQDSVFTGPGLVEVSGSSTTLTTINPSFDNLRLTSFADLALGDGGQGGFQVNNQFEWISGNIRDPNASLGVAAIAPGATLTLTGNATRTLEVDLVLGGNGSLVDNHTLLLNGGTLQVATGSTLSLLGTNTIGSTGSLNIDGTLVRNGTGTAVINTNLASTGTLDLQSGTLQLRGSSALGGTVNLAAVTLLDFNGGNHAQTGTVAGPGQIQVRSSATLSAQGDFNPGAISLIGAATLDIATANASTADLDVQSGTLSGAGQQLTVSDNFTWDSGLISTDVTVGPGADLNFDGNGFRTLDAATLSYQGGNGLWLGNGRLALANGGTFANNGTLRLGGDGLLDAGTAPGSLINTGTLLRQTSTGTFTIDVDVQSSGLIQADVGLLRLTRGGTIQGTLLPIAGAFELTGPFSFTDGSTLVGAEAIDLTGAAVSFDGITTGTTISGPMVFTDTALQGNGVITQIDNDLLFLGSNSFAGTINATATGRVVLSANGSTASAGLVVGQLSANSGGVIQLSNADSAQVRSTSLTVSDNPLLLGPGGRLEICDLCAGGAAGNHLVAADIQMTNATLDINNTGTVLLQLGSTGLAIDAASSFSGRFVDNLRIDASTGGTIAVGGNLRLDVAGQMDLGTSGTLRIVDGATVSGPETNSTDIFTINGGALVWTGGTLADGFAAVGQGLRLQPDTLATTGAGIRTLDAVDVDLVNLDVLDGTLAAIGGAVVNVTGTTTVNGTASLILDDAVLSGGSALNNAGLVQVLAGSASITGGGTSVGTFDVSNGAQLGFAGIPHSFGTNALFTGAGSIRIDSGRIDGATTVASGTTVDLDSTTLDGAGDLFIAGELYTDGFNTFDSGTVTVATGGVLEVAGSSDASFRVQELINNGEVQLTNVTGTATGAELTVITGFLNNGLVSITAGNSGGARRLNASLAGNGTIAVDTNTILDGPGPISLAGGQINVSNATLQVQDSFILNGGALQLAGGAIYEQSGGDLELRSGSITAGTGGGTLAAPGRLLVNTTGTMTLASGITLNADTLDITAGTLELAASGNAIDVQIASAGTLELSGNLAVDNSVGISGFLEQAPGSSLTIGNELTIDGSTNFQGLLQANTIQVSSRGDLNSGNAIQVVNAVIDGEADVIALDVQNLQLGGQLFADSLAVGNNLLVDGSLDTQTLSASGTLLNRGDLFAGVGITLANATVSNSGTLTAPGLALNNVSVTDNGFTELGSLDLRTGSSYSTSNSELSANSVTIASGTSLAIGTQTQANVMALANQGSVGVAGLLRLGSGNLSGNLVTTSNGQVVLDGTRIQGSTALSGPGDFLVRNVTITAGNTLLVATASRLGLGIDGNSQITGAGTLQANGTVRINGNTTFSNGRLAVGDAGTLQINQGPNATTVALGSFTNAGNTTLASTTGGTLGLAVAGTFTNSGTLVATGSSTSTLNGALQNTGTVRVEGTTLALNAGGADVTNTGNLLLNAGNLQASNIGTLNLRGPLALTNASRVNLGANQVAWQSGSIQGTGAGNTLDIAGTLRANGASNLTLGNVQALANSVLVDGAGLTVSGQLGTNTLAVGSMLAVPGTVQTSTGQVATTGRLQISGALRATGEFGIAGTLANTGSLEAATLTVTGQATNSGQANLGTLTINGGRLGSSGTLVANQAGVSNNGTLALQGGSTSFATGLQLANGGNLVGTGTLSGSVANNGRVAPGNSPGSLRISGNYTQGPNGILELDVGGTTRPGINYDQLAVGGTATLGGTLRFVELNGFAGTDGDTFSPITWANASGTFASTEFVATPGNPNFAINGEFGPNGFTATVGLKRTVITDPVENELETTQEINQLNEDQHELEGCDNDTADDLDAVSAEDHGVGCRGG